MTPSSRSAAILVLALACGATSAAEDPKAIQLTPNGCQTYAAWSGNLVWASDLGADKEKAKADLVARDRKTPSSIFALMLQNLDALWNTAAGWEEVTAVILQDCVKRRGAYANDKGETF